MSIASAFADTFEALNKTLTSRRQLMTRAGRAYYDVNGAPLRNPIYIKNAHERAVVHTSNLELFRKNPDVYGGGVYAGVGGLLNLSYIAVAKPRAALLYDINIHQVAFWRDVIAALAECKNADAFRKYLISYRDKAPRRLNEIFQDCATPRDNLTPQNLFMEFKTKTGLWLWLHANFSSEIPPDLRWSGKDYSHLHDLARERAIGAVSLDVTDQKSCEQLAAHLKNQSMLVNLLYISNIFYCIEDGINWNGMQMGRNGLKNAKQNISALLDRDKSIVIDSWYYPGLSGWDSHRGGRKNIWPDSHHPLEI